MSNINTKKLAPNEPTLTSFTPTIMFGGSNDGIEYSVQTGSHQLIGDLMFVSFTLALSNLGSATGAATIEFGGVATAPSASSLVGGVAAINLMVSTGVSVSLQSAASSLVFDLYQYASSGIVPFSQLTNANFIVGTTINFNGFYFVA